MRAPGHQSRRRRGFALVITVILLALLMLVLVSTATLTQIEASIGKNSRTDAQAQQNALYALKRAMGELQRHAGPDARITAQANITSASIANPYWTGVWNSGGTLQTWLVSGNEDLITSDGAFQQASAVATGISLVGVNSAGTDTARYVTVPSVALTATAPDGTADATVGRYAWWVGDDGVKSSMALPDRLSDVDYGPYASAELRQRLRQQVPFAHESFRDGSASGSPKFGFDPASNTAAISRIVARPQIAFLTKSATAVVLTSMKDRFHDWTNVSHGVLASTNPSYPGLRRDLSNNPGLLGTAFTNWAGGSAIETSIAPFSPAPSPAYTATLEDDVRRRYRITTATPIANDLVNSVQPVLTEFIVQFGFIRRPNSPLEIYMRMCCAVWNPYTSALAPEDMRLEITGLPVIRVHDLTADFTVDLQERYGTLLGSGSVVRVNLPFGTAGRGTAADRQSWLPGRVYYWCTETGTAAPVLANYSKLLSSANGWQVLTTSSYNLGAGSITVEGPSTTVSVKLTNSANTAWATYQGPAMPAAGDWITTFDGALNPVDWVIGFGFRLKQPSTNDATPVVSPSSLDPRAAAVVSSQLGPYDPGRALDPTQYSDSVSTAFDASGPPGFLLHRATTSFDFNNDTPVFELPRSPVLSLGMLQHLQISGRSPFSIGNSWGAGVTVNGVAGTVGSWFDRFYFSGVPLSGWGPNLSLNEPFPFYHLREFDPNGSLTLATFQSAGDFTSRHVMMAGAFNVNSTSVEAWAAVLKSLRPAATGNWTEADLDATTGGQVSTGATLTDNVEDLTQGATTTTAARAFGFMRFSQSAQETFETDNSTPSGINRSRYRQGFRGGSTGASPYFQNRNLTSTQIDELAARIVALVRTNGPIRTMEQFVSVIPSTTRSILEQAIVNADAVLSTDINPSTMEFSTRTLTQADILTAIGPFLQCRSDTFTIRTYGESVNPVTGVTDARAWCEATVQRVPTYVDPTDDPTEVSGTLSTTNVQFGRRFQIVAFRWLSPSDI